MKLEITPDARGSKKTIRSEQYFKQFICRAGIVYRNSQQFASLLEMVIEKLLFAPENDNSNLCFHTLTSAVLDPLSLPTRPLKHQRIVIAVRNDDPFNPTDLFRNNWTGRLPKSLPSYLLPEEEWREFKIGSRRFSTSEIASWIASVFTEEGWIRKDRLVLLSMGETD